MPDISTQFHALPTEIAEAVRRWRIEEAVIAVIAEASISNDGRKVVVFKSSSVSAAASAIDASPKCSSVLFMMNEPALGADSLYDFAKKNPDCIRLDIGRITGGCLQQSWLSARSENNDLIRIGRALARKIRGFTRPGMLAINRMTGEAGPFRLYRYSEGAKEVQQAGITITLFENDQQGPKLRIPVP